MYNLYIVETEYISDSSNASQLVLNICI